MSDTHDYSYRGHHQAPELEDGCTMANFGNLWPASDFSDPNLAARYYGHGGDMAAVDLKAAHIIARCEPDSEVTVYRAVPPHADAIHLGDWVSITLEYAVLHGERHLDDFKILATKVPATHLGSEGDLHEWSCGIEPERSVTVKADISSDQTPTP